MGAGARETCGKPLLRPARAPRCRVRTAASHSCRIRCGWRRARRARRGRPIKQCRPSKRPGCDVWPLDSMCVTCGSCVCAGVLSRSRVAGVQRACCGTRQGSPTGTTPGRLPVHRPFAHASGQWHVPSRSRAPGWFTQIAKDVHDTSELFEDLSMIVASQKEPIGTDEALVVPQLPVRGPCPTLVRHRCCCADAIEQRAQHAHAKTAEGVKHIEQAHKDSPGCAVM